MLYLSSAQYLLGDTNGRWGRIKPTAQEEQMILGLDVAERSHGYVREDAIVKGRVRPRAGQQAGTRDGEQTACWQ
jgi:hypothetical protein